MSGQCGLASQDAYYGANVTRRFGVPAPPATIVKTIRSALFAVTKIHCPTPERQVTAPTVPQNAYLLSVRLRDVKHLKTWIGGRLLPDEARPKGSATFLDLTEEVKFAVDEPINALHFYLHRDLLAQFTAEKIAYRYEDLMVNLGSTIHDPTLAGLAASILPALDHQNESNPLFVDHIAHSLLAYLSGRYGRQKADKAGATSGLAPWQLRRAQELIRERLNGTIDYADIARECGLSPGHFSRAFARSTGQAPHRWLTSRRIDLAKQQLLNPALPIAEIALDCGFADQAHFTRVFSTMTGSSPGRWRRSGQVLANAA